MSLSRSMAIFIYSVFAKYKMKTNAVIVTCDVHVKYSGASPVYRLYVGQELFTERTWIWSQEYLQEQIVLEAPYGVYPIRYELMPHPDAEIRIKNAEVKSGPGRFRKNLVLEIHDESS